MNIFAIFILLAILVDFFVGLVTNMLNMKSLSQHLPNEFEGVYDAQTYAKSQKYTKARTQFGLITGAFDLLILLSFWFNGGFNMLDSWIRGFPFNELISGIIFIVLLMIAKSILSLPFSIYSTFVIEEKFGFNKTTVKIFLLDLLKGTVLGALIGIPLLAGILAFFIYAGAWAWLYAWLAVTGFSLLMQYIAPTWIMPLFNKFILLEDGDLKTKIENYTQKVKFSLSGLFVIDGSKRSSKSNAFFTGFGKNKRIALYDTLIENHTDEELVAVLAHEIGHYKKKHIVKGMILSIAHSALLFFLLSFFLNEQGLFDAFYMDEISVYAGFVFFGMLYAPIEMILSVFMQISSRKHEFEADAFAVETTGSKEHMISTLKKLSKDNLSNLTPHSWYVFLNYSHPPVLKRIDAIKKIKL
jgi:STE24 endopeptidase